MVVSNALPTPLNMPKKRGGVLKGLEEPRQDPGTGEVANPLVYRTVLPISADEQDDVFEGARASFSRWLSTDKSIDADMSSGIHRLPEKRTIVVSDTYDREGREIALRLRLREERDNGWGRGVWQTTLTASVDWTDRRAFIGVDVEHYPPPDTPRPQYRTPRLVRRLLGRFHVLDGQARMTGRPQHIDIGDVDQLHRSLMDAGRKLPMVIAAEPQFPNLKWDALVERTARRLTGLATTFRLGRAAVTHFDQLIAESHQLKWGQIRTYLPEVDPTSSSDASRHRFLGFTWLQEREFKGKADFVIHQHPRLLSLRTPQPPLLARVEFPGIDATLLDRERTISRGHADTSDAEVLRVELENANGLFALAIEEVRESQQQLEFSDQRMRALEQDLADAICRYEDEIVDRADDIEELSRLRRRVAVLQKHLVDVGKAEEAFETMQAVQVPRSLDELNSMVDRGMPRLILTYDRTEAEKLDEDLKFETWTRKIWDCLAALDAFCQARTTQDFSGNFREYCRNTPQGLLGYSAERVAMVESESVRNDPRMSRQRMLPVPTEIDPLGSIFMESHVKIDSRGSSSPRVHFYDDTGGRTGRVVVGYIGRHLRNTKTS